MAGRQARMLPAGGGAKGVREQATSTRAVGDQRRIVACIASPANQVLGRDLLSVVPLLIEWGGLRPASSNSSHAADHCPFLTAPCS